jgi:hypothetical protein
VAADVGNFHPFAHCDAETCSKSRPNTEDAGGLLVSMKVGDYDN